jgi:hypothetical protein
MARIRTVSNTDSAAQYITIQAACDASLSGDSIFVSGSAVAYARFTIDNKRLFVFGPGWSPDKSNALTCRISGCVVEGRGASGSELHGLTFTSSVQINSTSLGINNLTFIRNKFESVVIYLYYSLSNFLFEGNWFENSYVNAASGNLSSVIFVNNIFFHATNYNIYGLAGTNIMFNHNLWYGSATGSPDCFNACANLMIMNDIFVRRNAANGNSNSSFQMSLTYLTTNNTPWKSNGSRDGGNQAGINPLMVAQTSVNTGVNNPLLDFSIPSGPANNAGNDGKDLGLLYDIGRTNWTRSRASNLPFIYKMTITSMLIQLGTNLQVTVDAKSN